MDPQAQELKALLDQMYAMMADNSKGAPLQINNADGSINYKNLVRLLQDDEYSSWRDQNPALAENATQTLRTDIATRIGQAGLTAAKVGFAMKQIRDAKAVDDTPPDFPARPRRNQLLRNAMADRFRQSREGMSGSERSALNQQLQQDFATNQQRILQTSGGQSGGAQSNMQVLARNKALAQNNAFAMNERQRRQNAAQFDALLPLSLQEDRQQYQYGLDKFNRRDMPLYQMKMQAKERLMQAGIQNLDAGSQALFGDLTELSNMFRGQMPGAAYSNQAYATLPDDHPLDAVFNNPIMNMQTDIPNIPMGGGVSGAMVDGYWINPLDKGGYYQNNPPVMSDPAPQLPVGFDERQLYPNYK